MNVIRTDIPDVLILEPTVYEDERGVFFESFNARVFREVTGVNAEFVQDNHSGSRRGVLRGLHYQIRQAQGKLVRVIEGEIWDVAVDLRVRSPTCGRWTGVRLSAANRRQVWIPPGFAHGFLTLSPMAQVLYKTTDYYAPEHERCIRWDDPALGIAWPLEGATPVLSARDAQGSSWQQAEKYAG